MVLPPVSLPVPSPVAEAMLRLDEIPRQVTAVVLGLADAAEPGDDVLLLRLAEIGFVPGEEVRVVAHGFPGGEPLAVRIGHTTFALRRHEAALVRIAVI